MLQVLSEGGYSAFLFRGLGTKILSNAVQGICFIVFWQMFQEWYVGRVAGKGAQQGLGAAAPAGAGAGLRPGAGASAGAAAAGGGGKGASHNGGIHHSAIAAVEGGLAARRGVGGGAAPGAGSRGAGGHSREPDGRGGGCLENDREHVVAVGEEPAGKLD